ncbi:MAG: hypothetical protein IKX25_04915 [Bacteroidales bacterium]|nr:hypothetical protein [Bacteroidales bacterium]
MKKFSLFSALLGAAYFIYSIYAYFSGERSLLYLIFSLLLAFSLIFTGIDKIFSLQQTHPLLYKFVGISFMIITVIYFIVALVVLYMERG